MTLINSAFTGSAYFRNGHLETIIPALFRKVNISFERKRMHLHDGDFMDLDFIENGNNKLLVLFHGLEGSSQSQYIKGFAKFFSERGYNICAVNFRGCSGQPNNLLRSYHSGATEDIHEALTYILKEASYTSVYLTGFSLGGNVLLKYMGDGKYKHNPNIKAVIAFSVPIDLAGGALQLARLSNKIYMARFLKSMNEKLIGKANHFENTIDVSDLYRIKNFTEWDTRYTAPIHGFKNASDYYEQCNSKQFLKNILIPTLLVNALNDPFLSSGCYPRGERETGKNVKFEAPEGGGHVGFMMGLPNGKYYSEQRALQFFNEHP